MMNLHLIFSTRGVLLLHPTLILTFAQSMASKVETGPTFRRTFVSLVKLITEILEHERIALQVWSDRVLFLRVWLKGT